jgi:hypothetical protein
MERPCHSPAMPCSPDATWNMCVDKASLTQFSTQQRRRHTGKMAMIAGERQCNHHMKELGPRIAPPERQAAHESHHRGPDLFLVDKQKLMPLLMGLQRRNLPIGMSLRTPCHSGTVPRVQAQGNCCLGMVASVRVLCLRLLLHLPASTHCTPCLVSSWGRLHPKHT